MALRICLQSDLFRQIAFIAFCLLYVVSSPIETRAEEHALTELVGVDVGISVEINGLKTQLAELPNAEWFQRLSQLPFVKKWQMGPEFSKFQSGRVALEAMVGQPLDRFSAELFGESVLLVVVPTKSGKTDAMLLSRAERDDSWDRVLRLWDQLEAHDVQTMSAHGRNFQRRRKKVNGQKAGPDIFTVKVGRTLAISESEAQIRSVLARAESNTATSRSANLANVPHYKNAIEALPADCSIRIVVSPRLWDTEFAKWPPESGWITAVWQKLKWVSLGMELHDGIIFHAVVQHETGGLPEIWQQVAKSSQEKSDLATRLPANSLLSGELQLDPRLLKWLRTLDQSERSQRDWQTFAKVSRGVLGLDLFDEVLPHFRPSIGGAILPSTNLMDQSAPVDAVLAWEFIEPKKSDSSIEGQPTFRESLDTSFSSLLSFASVNHNSRNPDSPAIVRRTTQSESALRWLEGLSPYRPAFGVLEKHLLVATDPKLISAFSNTTATLSLTAEPLFTTIRSRYFEDHPQWLFLNASATRRFVNDNHERLSHQLAYWRKIDVVNAGKHLDRLAEMLTPFDAAFSATKISAGEVRWTAGFATPAR